MKKNFLKSRTFAVIGMCVLILLSVVIGACRSVSRERGKAEAYFSGSDDVYGLAEDASWCSYEAANLVTLGARLLPADAAEVAETRHAREVLDAAVSPAEKYAALSSLTDRIHTLYTKLVGLELSEKDLEDCESVLASYNSNLDMISRSDYNQKAAAFNDDLRSTPGGAIASAFGARPLELFGPGVTQDAAD